MLKRATSLARSGPVHFQPLSSEIDQVSGHLRGVLLNAGCGNRDIADLVLPHGVTKVVNYDIKSDIPGAVLGTLTDLTFESNTFDTIFCNAVLEHVADIHRVMGEFRRVLKPGGRLVVGVPFLQPFHADPTDFRRYTADGLRELGALHDLETLEVLPVHSIAQTLGWIAWSYAQERGGWRPYVVFPLVWLSTRLSYRTDFKLMRNANTFQAVYRKP
jgi:SAM-dependent methyltransferase